MNLSIRQRSLLLTLFIHGAIVLFLIYAILTTPDPPMGGGEGVLVNIGYMDMASGEIQPMSENTTEDPVVKENVPPPVADEAPVVTQDIEDAVSIAKKEPKKIVKKVTPEPEKVAVIKKADPTPIIVERKADQKAIYKGKTNNSTSQGTATSGQGDQGDPSGDPNSKLYGKPGNGNGTGDGNGVGNGSGNGNGPGVSFTLKGRSKISLPKINDNSKDEGKVVIEIVVDKNGKVVSANGPSRGSTTTNSELVRKAKEGAMRAVFSASTEGVEEQRGTITFTFLNR